MSTKAALLLLSIALCSWQAHAQAQKTYRCGNTYSQTPCGAGAVTVDTADGRSKDQKVQTDNATRRDLKTANSMEKTRIQQEEARKRANTFSNVNMEKQEARKKAAEEKAVAEKDKPKPSTKKKPKKPEYFTAKKPAEPKKKKNETTAPQDGANPAANSGVPAPK
jgi:hypothetical protein